ncbi:hypothetical protein GCM10017714_18580 [Curtobacterium pusillum]|uniref:Uncharacterized protein n=1 Tax=Curtobacterium pusillum TaxID=69373 RepID=A0AAW3TD88_9MICO|nr:hypothetical protein [Curtobacterium pusillum]MBA8992007.1 hypothetical protein [Curtobacterium pusillum]NUU12391.1 hypothetical protein [Curtobacterium pusillum]GLK33092.1 hypothetical protein GCM10017610_33770 [Curtobacterium pusillum]
MGRTRARRPHRLALVVAAIAVLVGVGLLISPWDGLVVVVAWVLIGGGVVAGVLTLFFVRTPSS